VVLLNLAHPVHTIYGNTQERQLSYRASAGAVDFTSKFLAVGNKISNA